MAFTGRRCGKKKNHFSFRAFLLISTISSSIREKHLGLHPRLHCLLIFLPSNPSFKCQSDGTIASAFPDGGDLRHFLFFSSLLFFSLLVPLKFKVLKTPFLGSSSSSKNSFSKCVIFVTPRAFMFTPLTITFYPKNQKKRPITFLLL